MPDTNLTFNTPEKQTVDRAMLVAFINTATSSPAETPKWSPLGVRVSDSSEEIDWQKESSKDILGGTYSEMKNPIITQTFDPWPLTNGDEAVSWIWNLAVKNQDAQALANQDVLIVHKYAGAKDTAVFAERYNASAVEVTGLGGEGGGNIAMPVTVTYGGTRTTGTAKVQGGNVTFTPAGAAA